MSDPSPGSSGVPLSHLDAEDKAARAGSFGEVASHYERFRPGPPVTAVEWYLPGPVERIVDLGAGTGALTRLLIDRADEVVAVEPDDRMRSVLGAQVPGAHAVAGRGESIPLPDSCADVALASSSWHWMEPASTLAEVGRVLKPGGILGVLWSGPDPDGPFMAQAREMLAQRPTEGDGSVTDLVLGDALRPASTLEIPPGGSFGQPELHSFRWDVALDADDLIGLLWTLSWVITMPEEARQRLTAEARRLLRDLLGIEGEATANVAFRCDAWRSQITR